MHRLIVAAALLGACRGGHKDAGRDGPASGVSALVPKLPQSPDGVAALHSLDQDIAQQRANPGAEITLLLERAALRGRLEDYQDALARSAAWVDQAPAEPAAWKLRVRALSAVHRFAAARAALAKLEPLDDEARDLETAIDEATGHLERSAPVREALARAWPNPTHLVMWATSLALAGNLDAALAVMPRAAAAVHDNPPTLLSWLLFQWGRLYEQKGELAAARQFFEAARARLPTVESTSHLAQAMIGTGEAAAARRLVLAAVAIDRHPELLALAGRVAEARAEWERYVTALPEAFADHAARFYLGPGADPARAASLANQNLANRDTREARTLAAEAALAAGDAAGACAVVDPLTTAAATRAQRFVAWRALARCGRSAEADRLAGELGIAGPKR